MTIHLPSEAAMALALAFSNSDYGIAAQRRAAADAIEDLIAFLDDTDDNCDLEENGDERDSSWPESHVLRHLVSGAQSEDDEDDEVAEDIGDDEPTLGSPEIPAHRLLDGGARGWVAMSGTQEDWSSGSRKVSDDECETVNEDGGDVLDELHDGYLGWPEDYTAELGAGAQYNDAEVDDCDAEDSDADEGIEDAPHDADPMEYDLCFGFGLANVTGEFDGPYHDGKLVSDRPVANRLVAAAERIKGRIARAKAVA